MRHALIVGFALSFAAAPALAEQLNAQQQKMLVEMMYQQCTAKASADPAFKELSKQRGHDVSQSYCRCISDKTGTQVSMGDLMGVKGGQASAATTDKMTAIANSCRSAL